MLRNRLIYAAVLVGSVVFYAFYDQWFSTYFLILVLILPFFSLLCSLPSLLGLELRLWAPEAVRLGEQAVLTIRGKAPLFLPRYRLKLWASHSVEGDERLAQQAETPLPVRHCGMLTISAEKPRKFDCLGLVSLPIRGLPALRTLIRPVPVIPEQIPGLTTIQSPNLIPKPVGTFSEIHELRTYRPGDSLRSIHWKASAKTDELVVREPMEAGSAALVLTADLSGLPDRIDNALGQLLWMSSYLLEHELTHEIQVLTGNGVLRRTISTPEERDDAIDAVLACPVANAGSLKDAPIRALWRYHIDC